MGGEEGRRGSVVCVGGESQRALFAPLPLFSIPEDGSWLHLEMRLCVSNLGTGVREDLCFEQPEPETEGCWRGEGRMQDAYCFVPFTGKEDSSQQ